MRLGLLATHPIQYYAPWYRRLAGKDRVDLQVFFAHRPTSADQADAGFDIPFEWDVPLLEGYSFRFLRNVSGRPGLHGFFGCDTPELRTVIQRERFDAFIVHGWHTRSYWQAILACWRTDTPVMIRGDSQLLTKRPWWLRAAKLLPYRWFIRRFDAYLVVGERARAYYLAYGAEPSRMFFTPHAVDANRIARAATTVRRARCQLRKDHGIEPEGTVFLFAGKFVRKKRPLDFVRAVAAAARQREEIEGIMVGDGPLRVEIESEIARLGAPVRLLGFFNQSRMPEAYSLADVLVLPSDGGETWGLVVNEAMACGLPAIVSDQVGCVPDLVVDGETGWSYGCGDVGELSRRMTEAVDPHLRQRLGAAARQRTEAYSMEAATEGTIAALEAVLGRSGSR